MDLDDELVARAIRWCAEAGRHATAEAVRASLAPLSWDELLSARALLADPPPARPLGPAALADLARGASPDVAARRERDGQYGPRDDAPGGAPAPGAAAAAAPPARAAPAARGRRGRRARGPVIHRARDRADAEAPRPPELPLLDVLFASEGRAVLERLVRRHGARRGPLVAALAAGWRRPAAAGAAGAAGEPAAPTEADLERLLDAHGLSRGFAARERDGLLHDLRAERGHRAAAAARAGLSPAALDAALQRLGAAAEAEAIRDARRRELRGRATLSERARLLLEEREVLEDLGLAAEVEVDLRRRLPEHLRALRASRRGDLAAALGASLQLSPRALGALLDRLGVDLDAPAAAPRPGLPSPRPAAGPPSRPAPPGRPAHASGARGREAPRSRTGAAPRSAGPPRGAAQAGRGPPPARRGGPGAPARGRGGAGARRPGRAGPGRAGPGRAGGAGAGRPRGGGAR